MMMPTLGACMVSRPLRGAAKRVFLPRRAIGQPPTTAPPSSNQAPIVPRRAGLWQSPHTGLPAINPILTTIAEQLGTVFAPNPAVAALSTTPKPSKFGFSRPGPLPQTAAGGGHLRGSLPDGRRWDQNAAPASGEPQLVTQLMAELDRLRAELAETQGALAHWQARADEDPLLPLLNRRGFVRELDRALAYAKRYGGSGALLVLDLDGFKAVNDRYGHAAGDRALSVFAERLLASVRRSDVVGRLGGDEFAVLLHHATVAQAEAKLARLAAALAAEPVVYDSYRFVLGVSGGAVTLAPDVTAEALLAQADAAMYAHKRSKV